MSLSHTFISKGNPSTTLLASTRAAALAKLDADTTCAAAVYDSAPRVVRELAFETGAGIAVDAGDIAWPNDATYEWRLYLRDARDFDGSVVFRKVCDALEIPLSDRTLKAYGAAPYFVAETVRRIGGLKALFRVTVNVTDACEILGWEETEELRPESVVKVRRPVLSPECARRAGIINAD